MLEALIEILNRVAAIFTASLVDTLVVTVLGVAVAMVAARCKGWSAATRYGLWWLILAFVIATPVFWAVAAGTQDASANQTAITRVLGNEGTRAGASDTAPDLQQAVVTPPSSARLSVAAMFLLCWGLAAAVQTLRVVRGFLYGRQLKRFSIRADQELEGSCERLRVKLSMRRRVRISVSSKLTSPAVIGYVAPHVIIPAGLAARLSMSEMEQILLHELAHLARYDDWSIAAQRIVEAAAVCHPLVRYIAHRLNLDREMACDDRVAETHDRGCYAECLAKMAQMTTFPIARAVLVPLMERKPDLLARVEVLLDNTRTHLPQASLRRLLVTAAGFIVLGAAGLRVPRLIAMPAYESYMGVREQQTSQQTQELAAPAPEKAAEHSQPSINSIVITSQDGSSSSFGSWSRDSSDADGRQSGTIEFRSENKIYIIRDKGVLAEAQKILQPMEDLGRRQSELGEKQSKLGEVQSFLGEQQQKVSDQPLDASMRAKLAQELQALKAQIDEVNAKHLAERANDVQAQLANLQSALAQMQSEMGLLQSKLGEDQGLLGEKQGRLGEQQAELGKIQAELGAKQAAESKRIEKKLHELIHSAQARGLAEQAH